METIAVSEVSVGDLRLKYECVSSPKYPSTNYGLETGAASAAAHKFLTRPSTARSGKALISRISDAEATIAGEHRAATGFLRGKTAILFDATSAGIHLRTPTPAFAVSMQAEIVATIKLQIKKVTRTLLPAFRLRQSHRNGFGGRKWSDLFGSQGRMRTSDQPVNRRLKQGNI